MSYRIELRRGTGAQWTAANPILLAGEPGVESDAVPPKVKYGNGINHWNDLPYSGGAPASEPSEVEFLYRYSSGGQTFQNATPPYAEEGDPAEGADKGRIRVTVFTEDSVDGIHPNMLWHADTHEVEFLADGAAYVELYSEWGKQTDGGVCMEIKGPTYELAAGGTHAQVLHMASPVPLTLDTATTDDHTSHTGGGVAWSGVSALTRAEEGDRWRVVARVGSTASAVLGYADIGVYFTAGY